MKYKTTMVIPFMVICSLFLFAASTHATEDTYSELEYYYQEKAMEILRDTPEREPLTAEGKKELIEFIEKEYMPIDGCSLLELPKDSDIHYQPSTKKEETTKKDSVKKTTSLKAENKVTKQEVQQLSKTEEKAMPTYQGKIYTLTEEEQMWLERLVEAEATGEPYEGKVAVATVIANRIESDSFPNDVMSVIKANNGEFHQFSPWDDGRIHKVTPKESTKKAVNVVFKKGHRNLPRDVVYFAVKDIAFDNWMGKTRKYTITIGNHAFFSIDPK